MRRLFDEITDGYLQWEPMGEVYDTVVIDGQRWEYVAGREHWRDRMHEYFPDEATAIDRYLELVRDAIGGARTFFAEKALPGPAALLAGPWMRRGDFSATPTAPWARSSTNSPTTPPSRRCSPPSSATTDCRPRRRALSSTP